MLFVHVKAHIHVLLPADHNTDYVFKVVTADTFQHLYKQLCSRPTRFS